MSKRPARLLLLLLLLWLVASTWATAAPAQSTPRQITINVSQYGWNNDPNAVFTVEEGEVTELVFIYGDGDMAEDNPHIMMIEGMDVESGKLSKANPREVLRIRPEKTGTYSLQCKLTCTGHGNLTDGKMRVIAAGGAGGAVEPETTSIAVTTVPPATPGQPAEVRARVTTAGGVPLEGVTVDFGVKTTFLISEWLEVGKARTGSNGEAVLQFVPNRGGDQTVRARYEGSGRYVGSEKMLNLAVPEMALEYQQPAGLAIPGLGYWLLWVVVGSIWFTYLLVFYNLRQMMANR